MHPNFQIRTKRKILLTTALVSLVSVAERAMAADLTWDNGAANEKWNTTASNWSGGSGIFANGDSVTFGAIAAGNVDVNVPKVIVETISFGAGGYDIGGGTIESGNGTDLTINANANAEISSDIRLIGGANIIINGTNTLSLSGTVDGDITHNAALLDISGGNVTGTIAANKDLVMSTTTTVGGLVTVAATATVSDGGSLNSGIINAGTYDITGNGSADNLLVGGDFTNTGSITNSGGGTVTLNHNGVNDFINNGGTISGGAGQLTIKALNGTIMLNSGTVTANANLLLDGDIENSGTLIYASTNALTGSLINESGGLLGISSSFSVGSNDLTSNGTIAALALGNFVISGIDTLVASGAIHGGAGLLTFGAVDVIAQDGLIISSNVRFDVSGTWLRRAYSGEL